MPKRDGIKGYLITNQWVLTIDRSANGALTIGIYLLKVKVTLKTSNTVLRRYDAVVDSCLVPETGQGLEMKDQRTPKI